ncbi:hypothetical protein RND71_029920 [Anisodus tanguticus]|uniref:Uncharacterized protein n=1 Tax=Anisodus tanguticus TaxID=243964 RepID=A0AAE1RGQ9_9SOLA|nr:hypothetical protein RND71_029920 [Anisodus tanguticus]
MGVRRFLLICSSLGETSLSKEKRERSSEGVFWSGGCCSLADTMHPITLLGRGCTICSLETWKASRSSQWRLKSYCQIFPPPPQEIPPGVVPMKVEPVKGCGSVSERLRPNFNQMNRPRPGVNIHYENGDPVTQSNLIRKVIYKLWEIYSPELGEQAFASDGQQSLFTTSPLPKNRLDFTVVLDSVTSKRSKIDGNFSGNGDLSEGDQKRQKIISLFKTFKVQIAFVSNIPFQSMLDGLHGVKSGNNEKLPSAPAIILPQCDKELDGGKHGCRDTSTTTVVQPGPLVNFLIANQNVDNPFKIDWTKAKQILKNLRIKLSHSNREHKITGLSNRPCREEKFLLKLRGSDNPNDNVQTVEVTVYEYFVRRHGIELSYSSSLPCINVGSQHKPQFIPVELCSLVSLQQYKKELSSHQRSLLVNKSSQKPIELMKHLNEELITNEYDNDPMLRACGISIDISFTQVGGRTLSPPQFAEPKGIEFWAVANFSTGYEVRAFCIGMAKLGATKGMHIRPPAFVFEENAKHKKKTGSVRVDKFSNLYGCPWKKKCLMNFGICNQCIAKNRADETYLANVILKINAKTIPLVSKVPTMILAMSVTHAPSSRTDLPSVAAVVGSRQWLMISCYRASVCTQPPKTETIHSLFRPVSDREDTGIIRQGLSESQFKQIISEMEEIFKGTSRPIHYFVLLDEIGFSSDNVQELVHCLCYVSQRCTSAIYEVAPIRYARLASAQMAYEEVAIEAIKHAIKALRKRHLVEEGAHAPAIAALNRPLVLQGSEWKEKAENLEVELQQCYKAQSRLSEQLVVEVAESRVSKSLVQEKETIITDLQNELSQARDECSRLTELLEEKTKALELLMGEHQDLKAQLEATSLRANNAEAENKTLVDRWMLQKMQDAERLNEANALYEDMLDKVKAASIEKLARQQVDGVVRQSEDGAEFYVESSIPSTCKQRIPAHDGGCASILFEYNSNKLISGGQDRTIKMWDTTSGSLTNSLYGCLGSVLDLSITHDNKFIIAASSSNNLYVWDANSGRIRHTLTGHIDKVCAVDVSKFSSRHVVSAAYDRTIKVWDLQKGYCTNTIIFHSNCNSLSFSMDGLTICSGHVDGNLRLWDIQTGKLLSEVAAHSQAVTSVSLSRNGNMILTSGRDNLHNLFDIRTLEICGTFRANANRVASNWSRSCISADDSYVTAGSVDGSVHIWSVSNAKMIRVELYVFGHDITSKFQMLHVFISDTIDRPAIDCSVLCSFQSGS